MNSYFLDLITNKNYHYLENFEMDKNIDTSIYERIVSQLEKYNITHKSSKELFEWIADLNDLEIQNILSLDIDPEDIKFKPDLLIDKNLLNTLDYIKKVEAFTSIENAEGWYHLFNKMLNPDFLNSPKFYQDIEVLKKAKCAQTPLWIIGDSTFINSPYHDEDFNLLVTAKDTSDKHFDYAVWEAIANIASNKDSIQSEYHRQDLQTIIKYGSKSLQLFCSYPEGSINYLAINPVSLNDIYHLENMEILAKNQEIGNFLYAVMTNEKAIKNENYRRIINEMVEHKTNIKYVFLICYYAIGEKAIDAQNVLRNNYYYEISSSHDINELLKKVEAKINNTDDTKDSTYEIEYNEFNNAKKEHKTLLKRIFKK